MTILLLLLIAATWVTVTGIVLCPTHDELDEADRRAAMLRHPASGRWPR